MFLRFFHNNKYSPPAQEAASDERRSSPTIDHHHTRGGVGSPVGADPSRSSSPGNPNLTNEKSKNQKELQGAVGSLPMPRIASDPVPVRFRRTAKAAAAERVLSPTFSATEESGETSLSDTGALSNFIQHPPPSSNMPPIGESFASSGVPAYWRVPLMSTSPEMKPATTPDASLRSTTVLTVERTAICPFCRRPAMPRGEHRQRKQLDRIIRAGVRQADGVDESESSSSLTSSTHSSSLRNDGNGESGVMAYCHCGRTTLCGTPEQNVSLPVYVVRHQSSARQVPGTLRECDEDSSSSSSLVAASPPLGVPKNTLSSASPLSHPQHRDPVGLSLQHSDSAGDIGTRFKYAVVTPLTTTSLQTSQRQFTSPLSPPPDAAKNSKAAKRQSVHDWLNSQTAAT